MGDKKVNGKYLPKGIYFERVPVSFNMTDKIGKFTNNWHSYLVYRDGKGNAEVIRGGIKLDMKSLREVGDLELEIGLDISKSKDSYGIKEDPQTRHAVRLNIPDNDVENKWEEMKKNAQKIDPKIDYKIDFKNANVHFNFKQKTMTFELGKESQVCHSVTGTILQEAGISAEDLSKQANIDLRQFGGLKTNLLRDENLEKKDQIYEFLEKVKNNSKNKIDKVERNLNNLKINFFNGNSVSYNETLNRIKINSDDEKFSNFIAQTAKSCFNKNIKIEHETSSKLHNNANELNNLTV